MIGGKNHELPYKKEIPHSVWGGMRRRSVLMDAAVVLDVEDQVFAAAAMMEMPGHREDADDGMELGAVSSPHFRVAQGVQEVWVDAGAFPEVVQGVAMGIASPVLVPPVHFQTLVFESDELCFIECDIGEAMMAHQLTDSCLQLVVFGTDSDVPQDDSHQARHKRSYALTLVEAVAAIDDYGFGIGRTEVLFHEILRLKAIIHPIIFFAFCQGMTVCVPGSAFETVDTRPIIK